MGIASALNKKKQGVIKGDASWNHGHEIPPNTSRVKRCKKLSTAVGAKSKQHRLTNGHPVTYFSSLLPSFPLFPLLFFPSSFLSSPLPLFPSFWLKTRARSTSCVARFLLPLQGHFLEETILTTILFSVIVWRTWPHHFGYVPHERFPRTDIYWHSRFRVIRSD